VSTFLFAEENDATRVEYFGDGEVNIRASQKIFRDVEGRPPSPLPRRRSKNIPRIFRRCKKWPAANIIRLPGCEYLGASKILDGGFPNIPARKKWVPVA